LTFTSLTDIDRSHVSLNESSMDGTDRRVMKAFARALECIPSALIHTTGTSTLQPLDSIRQSYLKNSEHIAGYDVRSETIVHPTAHGILDSYRVKVQSIYFESTVTL
jgi:chaperonin GroEL (HSP60 family)